MDEFDFGVGLVLSVLVRWGGSFGLGMNIVVWEDGEEMMDDLEDGMDDDYDDDMFMFSLWEEVFVEVVMVCVVCVYLRGKMNVKLGKEELVVY